MKDFELESWISLNRITAGRRAHAVKQVKAELLARGQADLIPLCDQIIAAERDLIALMREFRNSQATTSEASWTPEIIAQDQLLDRLLSELRDLLETLGKRTGTPRGDAAKAIYDVTFASGLAWFTQAPIDEENERVGELLARLSKEPEKEKLEKATADDLVADVTAAHVQYDILITAFRKTSPRSHDEIKAADLANQRLLLALVNRVITWTLDLPEAEQILTRAAVLRPIAEKDREMSDLVRSRRKIRDVHPETGQPEAES